MNKLENMFEELTNKVIESSEKESKIVFTSEILPISPDIIGTDKIYIKKASHAYGSHKVDSLWFFAHKTTYIKLGLLILSVIFQKGKKRVRLKLKHTKTDIKEFVIENNYENIDNLMGLYCQPYAFGYWPENIDKHPFYNVSVEYLPCFSLTDKRDCPITEKDWKNRNVVICCGNDQGSVLFAELLLNFGLPSNTLDEIELESECGYRGVSKRSAEIQLFLPGHNAWIDDFWP